MHDNVQPALQQFTDYRDRLAYILGDIANIFNVLGQPRRCEDLVAARTRLLEQCFRLMVLGEMKRGKSTLVNAMLGERVLPSQPGIACTAIPTTVRHGERRRALCFRREPFPPDELDLAYDPGGLWKTITIPNKLHCARPEDDGQAAAINPYVRAEVFWPVELLRNGVEIEDSAGLNEGEAGGVAREAATWDRVRDVDAVLLVWSCNQIGKDTELKYLEQLLHRGLSHRALFVILNHFELIRKNPVAGAEIRSKVREVLQSRNVREDRVHYLSALEAEEGRADRQPQRLIESGLPAFEKVLSEFLLNERSAAKLLTSLSVAEMTSKEALHDVQRREASEPENMVRETARMAASAADARQRVAEMNRRVARKMEDTSKHLASGIGTSIRDLGTKLIQGVPEQLASAAISSWEAITDAGGSKRYLARRILEWTTQQTQAWERETLSVLVHEYILELRNDIEDSAKDIELTCAKLRADWERFRKSENNGDSSVDSSVAGQSEQEKSGKPQAVRTVESILDRAESDFSPAPLVAGLAVTGAVVGTVFAAILVAPLLPFVLIGAGLAALFGGMSAADRLKARMAATCQQVIRDSLPELEKRFVDATRQKFEELMLQIKVRLDELCCEIQRYDKAIGQAHIEKQRRAAEVREICSRLRSRIQEHSLMIETLRREIDPLQNSQRLATSLEPMLTSIVQQTADSRDGNVERELGWPTLDELRVQLGKEVWQRLEMCVEYLQTQGRWSPDRKPRLAFIWSMLKGAVLSSSDAQLPAFRAVTALSVAEGEDNLPNPAEVRRRWREPEYKVLIVELYKRITGADDGTYFADAVGEKMRGIDKFILAYKRALDNIQSAQKRAAGEGDAQV